MRMKLVGLPFVLTGAFAAAGGAAGQTPGGAKSAKPLPIEVVEPFPLSMDPSVLETWLARQTTIRSKDVIAVGGGRVVALTSKRPLPGAGVVRLAIRTEIIDPDSARLAKGLSEFSEVDVDCVARKAKVDSNQVYSLRNMTGSLTFGPGWTEWAAATPGTTLGRMAEVGCEGASPSVAKVSAAVAPAKKPGRAELRGPAGLPAADEVLASPMAPLLKPISPPIVANIGAPQTAVSKPAPAAASPRLPSSRPTPSRPIEGFASLAQINAASREDLAQRALDDLARKAPALMHGRLTTIERTDVAGQTYYRALVGGFSNVAQVGAFCAQVKAGGGDCLIRQR